MIPSNNLARNTRNTHGIFIENTVNPFLIEELDYVLSQIEKTDHSSYRLIVEKICLIFTEDSQWFDKFLSHLESLRKRSYLIMDAEKDIEKSNATDSKAAIFIPDDTEDFSNELIKMFARLCNNYNKFPETRIKTDLKSKFKTDGDFIRSWGLESFFDNFEDYGGNFPIHELKRSPFEIFEVNS